MGGSGGGIGSLLKVILTNFDLLAGPVVSLVYPLLPFWSYAKLIATCWLVIPYYNGAAYVYEHYVRPCIVQRRAVNIWYVPRKNDVFSKPDDILTAAENYMKEHGTQAFEEMIHKAGGELKTHTSNYTFSDDKYRYRAL